MTEKEKLEFLNKELNTHYTSLEGIFWDKVSYKYDLSENFIRVFADKVDWEYIFEYQTLSKEFKKEFKHKVK